MFRLVLRLMACNPAGIMRFSRIIPLLFLMTVPAIAAPKEIEIPKDDWASHDPIIALTKEAKWTPLREVDVQDGSLEVRIWFVTVTPSHGIRLCRNGDKWSAFYVAAGLEGYQSFQIRELKPQTDWASLWKKVEGLGISTLPDSWTLPYERYARDGVEVDIKDGIAYVVEINDGKHYRTYMYCNPQYLKSPEAKKIIEIIKALGEELLPGKKIT